MLSRAWFFNRIMIAAAFWRIFVSLNRIKPSKIAFVMLMLYLKREKNDPDYLDIN